MSFFPRNFNFFLGGAFTVLAPVALPLALLLVLEASLSASFGKSETQIYESRVSPDGTKAATLCLNMGGGAAGWCNRYVDVHSATETQVDIQRKVFRTDCQSDIDFVWENDAVLRISYEGDREISSLLQRKSSRDGAVRILYSGK